ncbi:MAG TPA: carboxypeptidase regulatory-like domain-containing protein [Pyrinomonadaceae bacterium]
MNLQAYIKRGISFLLILALCAPSLLATTSPQQQATGGLRGQVTDEFGGVIVGANVSVVDANGVEKSDTTDADGNFSINGLAPGRYIVRVVAGGFALYENAEVDVVAGRREALNIKLGVALEKEEVVVAGEAPLDATNNADAIVLKGKDLEALPDDPDDLAAALTALAGPSAGPSGGQIYIDGFTGGRVPPKEAIREVRVNQNPFNAENDQPGFGRVDILTRPGMDKFRGSASFGFNDESLNSRNVFVSNRSDFQSRLYSLNLSGPVISKKASFFVDFQRRDEDDNDVVNARVLDPLTFEETPFVTAILTPRRFTTFSPRFDYAFNQNHTLIARYSYTKSSNLTGVGGFNLPSRAFDTAFRQHMIQLTETAIVNPQVINETRFQFTDNRRESNGDIGLPAVQVLDAFTSGGSQVLSSVDEKRWELQNYTTATKNNHVIRFGIRLRGVKFTDIAENNFGGTFVFAGGAAPQLDAANNVVTVPDPDSPTGTRVVTEQLTSTDRLRRTLRLQSLGFSFADIIARGGGPTQFTINGGNPEASVSQVDFGGFIQDEWRLRPNFSLTLGLRYETQSNISSKYNFAPRLFFAWAPGGTSTGTLSGPFGGGGAGQPKFVIRGGFGMFYDRFNESGTLQANRFDGQNQARFFLTGDALGGIGNVFFNADGTVSNQPSFDDLDLSVAQQQTRTVVADNLQAPYGMLAAIQVERQLPYGFTVFGVLFSFRQRHAFVLRNINAPLPGTFRLGEANDDVQRPFGNSVGDIYQYESSGTFNDVRGFLGIRNQLRNGLSIFANYQTGKARSNTDCIFGNLGQCFPADSYNLAADYGRVSFFPRHRFILGGSLAIPKLNISLNPFVIASTGNFFNITTGQDNNGDRIFRDRPAFADAQTVPEDLRVTPYGNFDINPKPGQTIIPRNYGEGPSFFSFNLGISRTIGFGDVPGARANAAPPAAAPQGGGRGGAASAAGPRVGGGAPGGQRGAAGGGGGGQRGGGGGGGGGFGGPGGGGGGNPEKRYNLTMSLNIQNLFNRTNLGLPNGNLSSPFFNQSLTTVGGFGGPGGGAAQGNRRITAQLRFNF